jgi:hypothetical protein
MSITQRLAELERERDEQWTALENARCTGPRDIDESEEEMRA